MVVGIHNCTNICRTDEADEMTQWFLRRYEEVCAVKQTKVCRTNFCQRISNQFCKSVKRHLAQVSSFTWCKLHESCKIETLRTIEPLCLLIWSYWIGTDFNELLIHTASMSISLSPWSTFQPSQLLESLWTSIQVVTWFQNIFISPITFP